MRNRFNVIGGMLVACLGVPMLTGCQSGSARYREQLSQAHTALRAGEPGRASRVLASADQTAREKKLARSPARDLIASEMQLQQGDVYQALETSQRVASSSPANSVARARADEITGKAALRQAQYAAAVQHFRMADALYGTRADHERIANLIRLAEGLEAYSSGRLDQARKTWDEIDDPQMRDSISKTLRDERTADSTALSR